MITRACTADPSHNIGRKPGSCPTCRAWLQILYRRAAVRLRERFPEENADVEALAYDEHLRKAVK